MSSDSVHVVIIVGIIALMFAWVPFLYVVYPTAWRMEKPPSEKKKEGETPQQKASGAPPSSRRLAEKSRDFLQALSTREIPRSGVGVPQAPPSSCAE